MILACVGVVAVLVDRLRVHARRRAPSDEDLRGRQTPAAAGESRDGVDDRGIRLLPLSSADHAERARAASWRHGGGRAVARPPLCRRDGCDRALGGRHLAWIRARSFSQDSGGANRLNRASRYIIRAAMPYRSPYPDIQVPNLDPDRTGVPPRAGRSRTRSRWPTA